MVLWGRVKEVLLRNEMQLWSKQKMHVPEWAVQPSHLGVDLKFNDGKRTHNPVNLASKNQIVISHGTHSLRKDQRLTQDHTRDGEEWVVQQ